MFRRRRTPPRDLKVYIASTDSSPRASVVFDEQPGTADAPMADYTDVGSRPLSVSIPKSFGASGPYCARRPTLSEILANESSPPWTLSAFMAYLSQNHCLETLEFTMDASRYGKHYAKMVGRIPGGTLLPSSEEAAYLKMLWTRLMEAYILPNGPREVNLPAEVRNELLSLVDTLGGPPAPARLDNAVHHIYMLMEESVLIPFLNSFYPQSAHPAYGASSDSLTAASHTGCTRAKHPVSSHSYDAGATLHQRSKRRSSPHGHYLQQAAQQQYPQQQLQHQQQQPQLYQQSLLSPTTSNTSQNRASAPSGLSTLLSGGPVRRHRSSSNPAHPDFKSPSPSDLADDLMSIGSAMTCHSLSHESAGSVGLHTPPTTPPMSDCQPYSGDVSPGSADLHSPSDPSSPRETAWKRGMTKLGLRKSNRSRASGFGFGPMEE